MATIGLGYSIVDEYDGCYLVKFTNVSVDGIVVADQWVISSFKLSVPPNALYSNKPIALGLDKEGLQALFSSFGFLTPGELYVLSIHPDLLLDVIYTYSSFEITFGENELVVVNGRVREYDIF